MKKLLFPILAILGCGCGSVKSDYSYQKGKEAFWNGSYDEAIVNLNQAIEYDPTCSRNHQQLALTYEKIGDISQAWEHARTAYSLDRHSQNAKDIFVRVYSELSKQNRFDARKPSAKSLIDILGVADTYLHDDKGNLKALYYGPLCLNIADGKLKSYEWLKQ
jgi:tetratricopeptide (TPR) repeat protein